MRVRHKLDIVAAFLEQALGVRCLKIIDPNFSARDMGGNGQHGHAVALAIEETVYEMQISRPAAAGANGQLAGQVGLRSSSESGSLFMTDMYPSDGFLPAQ